MKFLLLPSSFFLLLASVALAATPISGDLRVGGVLYAGSGVNALTNTAGKPLGVPGPVFNVKTDFGAAADGTTNDTTAVSNAIAAAVSAGGGTVYFPGLCKITSTLTISSSAGIRLLGGERNTCGLKASSQSMGALLSITGANVTVENMKLDGVYASGTTSGDFGMVNVTGADNTRVRGCLIVNTLNAGVRIYGASTDTKIEDTRFKNNFIGIKSYSASSSAAPQRITISRCDFLSGWSNDGESGAIKLQTNPTDAITSAGHRVENCSVYNAGQMGIEFWKGIINSTITGNTIEGTDWGISLDGSTDITVTSNTVRRFSYLGIESASITGDNAIVGNTVDGRNGSGVEAGTAGIITSNTAPLNILIAANIVHHVPTAIQIQTTNKVTIANNWIHDCSGYALNLKGSNYVSVRGNGFFGPFSPSHVWIETYGANITDIVIAGNDFFGNAGSNVVSIYDGVGTNTATNISITRNNTKGATTSANNVWSNLGARLTNFIVRQNEGNTGGSAANFADDPADLAASYLDQSVKTTGAPSFAQITVAPGGVNSAKITLNGTATGTDETGYVEWKQSGTLGAKISSFGTNKDMRFYTNGSAIEALWLKKDGTAFFRQWLETTEQGSAPSAPASNGARIYAVDNGSGKTVLKVRFATGAEQTLATEP